MKVELDYFEIVVVVEALEYVFARSVDGVRLKERGRIYHARRLRARNHLITI